MSEYIAHYGIKGMKWGVRNAETQAKYAGGKGGKRKKFKDFNSSKSGAKSRSGLSDRQKTYLKRGAIAAGIGLAVIGGVALYRSGALQKMGLNAAKNAIGSQVGSPLTKVAPKAAVKEVASGVKADRALKLPFKTSKMTAEQDLAKVNPMGARKLGPFMHRGLPGTSMNCTNCSFAYDARRRGLDVSAFNRGTGRMWDDIEKLYSGDRKFTTLTAGNLPGKTQSSNRVLGILKDAQPLTNTKDAAKAIEAEVKAMGDGARGHLGGTYSFGGGHDIIFENVGGKVVIRDGQINKTYTSIEKAIKAFDPSDIRLLRVDDLDINPEFVNSAVRPAADNAVKTSLKALKSDPTIQIETATRVGSAAVKGAFGASIVSSIKEDHDNRKRSA